MLAVVVVVFVVVFVVVIFSFVFATPTTEFVRTADWREVFHLECVVALPTHSVFRSENNARACSKTSRASFTLVTHCKHAKYIKKRRTVWCLYVLTFDKTIVCRVGCSYVSVRQIDIVYQCCRQRLAPVATTPLSPYGYANVIAQMCVVSFAQRCFLVAPICHPESCNVTVEMMHSNKTLNAISRALSQRSCKSHHTHGALHTARAQC